jgi:hypothetical protein
MYTYRTHTSIPAFDGILLGRRLSLLQPPPDPLLARIIGSFKRPRLGPTQATPVKRLGYRDSFGLPTPRPGVLFGQSGVEESRDLAVPLLGPYRADGAAAGETGVGGRLEQA